MPVYSGDRRFHARLILFISIDFRICAQVIVDSINNTWACVRSLDADHAGQDEIYCNFYDGTSIDVNWVRGNNNSNFAEYYDMSAEPWQLQNGLGNLTAARRKLLQGRLEKLMVCKGRAECEEAAAASISSLA